MTTSTKQRIAVGIATLALAVTGATGVASAATHDNNSTAISSATLNVQDLNVDPVSYEVSTGDILGQTNEVRAQAGVAPLAYSADTGAQDWANYMASTGDFRHDTTQSVGQNDLFAENVYYRGADDGVLYAVDSWTNSPGHYANMVNGEYHSMSVGAAVSDSGDSYVVQRFYFS